MVSPLRASRELQSLTRSGCVRLIIQGVKMNCPGCGKQIEEGANFCPYCDRKLSGPPPSPGVPGAFSGPPPQPGEQVLYGFGPFGVDVCNGPFKMFTTWHRRNSIIIELTNTRLCALPNRKFGLLTVPATGVSPGVRLPFQIPYASIESAQILKHPSPISLMDILNIKYLEGTVEVEKSIASYSSNISRAYQVLLSYKRP